MNLIELLAASSMDGVRILGGNADQVDINHIAEDSRRMEPGCLFVAVVGRTSDGHRFVSQALHNGAVAVAGNREERPEGLPGEVPYVYVPDARTAVALFSAAFFDFPSRKLQ